MDIRNYVNFFHDGTLIDIKHINNNLQLFIESFPIDQNDLSNNDLPFLSPNNTLKGTLHADGIKYIKIEKKLFHEILCKEYDDGEILDLIVNKNTIIIIIEWKNFPPKKRIIVTNEIEIESEVIYWESVVKKAND